MKERIKFTSDYAPHYSAYRHIAKLNDKEVIEYTYVKKLPRKVKKQMVRELKTIML